MAIPPAGRAARQSVTALWTAKNATCIWLITGFSSLRDSATMALLPGSRGTSKQGCVVARYGFRTWNALHDEFDAAIDDLVELGRTLRPGAIDGIEVEGSSPEIDGPERCGSGIQRRLLVERDVVVEELAKKSRARRHCRIV